MGVKTLNAHKAISLRFYFIITFTSRELGEYRANPIENVSLSEYAQTAMQLIIFALAEFPIQRRHFFFNLSLKMDSFRGDCWTNWKAYEAFVLLYY